MHPERWARLEPQIDELLTLPPLDRARRLDEIAANDPATAAELRELLKANDDASRAEFLAAPAAPAFVPAGAVAGDVLGQWTLVQPIGEGGMGSVWRARRSDGRFEGEAAVKLLKSGLFDAAAQERFRREGAILARLHHPGIAQLLDAGITAKGQPYLVLELVHGERIDRWCEAHSLDTRACIELFLQALEAVAAAHGQLVIHRDLKPSNILVDGQGRVKLLDFGIARLLPGQDDAEETALTRAGAFALTPQYAAPEQFEGGMLGMATDVFALGIVLYELLTHVHPSGLKDAPPLDYLRAAGEGRYRPASERAPDRRRDLQGDLDNILAKALAPRPEERYASVTAFADDLRRHLNDEPVAAQPGTLAYRAAKFVRRNRLAVAAGAAVIAALAIGLAATLWMGAEANRQRDIALAQKSRAESEAAQAKRQTERALAVQSFLVDLFAVNTVGQADPRAAQDMTARQLLDRGARDLDKKLAGQPESQLEIAKTIASLYGELVIPEQALKFRRKQLELARSLYGADAIETASAEADLADLLKMQDSKESLGLARHAEHVYDAHAEQQASVGYGMLQITLAELLNATDLDAAEKHVRSALRVFAATPSDIRYGLAHTRLGSIMYYRGKMDEAEADYVRAVGIYEAAGAVANPLITAAYSNLGRIQEMRLEFDPAEQSYRRAVAASQRINGPNHATTIIFRGGYAAILAEMSRLPEALAIARENETALRSASPEQQQRYTRNVQAALSNIELQYGLVAEAGRNIEAATDAEQKADPSSRRTAEVALAAARAAVERGDLSRADEHLVTVNHYIEGAGTSAPKNLRSYALAVTARLDAARGRCVEALARLGAAPAKLRFGTYSEFRDAIGEAELRADCDETKAADALAAGVLAAIEDKKLQKPLALLAAQAQVVRARAALAGGDAAAAERFLRLALPMQAPQYDEASPRVADTRLYLAAALVELGRRAPARELVASARAALSKQPAVAAEHGRLLAATARIAATR